MTNTPEVPSINPEPVKSPESLGEIPAAVEQGQPVVQQQPQQVVRPVTTVTTTLPKPAQTPTVTVPADPAQLTQLAKGNPVNALTWFAGFWLRMIKKAVDVGASIMTSQSIKIPSPVNQQISTDASQAFSTGQGQISDSMVTQNPIATSGTTTKTVQDPQNQLDQNHEPAVSTTDSSNN